MTRLKKNLENTKPVVLYVDAHGTRLMARGQFFRADKYVLYTEPQGSALECTIEDMRYAAQKLSDYVALCLMPTHTNDKYSLVKYDSDQIILEMNCLYCGTLLTFTLTDFLTKPMGTMCRQCGSSHHAPTGIVPSNE